MAGLPVVETGAWLRAPASVSRPIFAIGDVHGRAAELAALHDTIRRRVAEDNLANVVCVHLGDYIDRGPQSMRALCMALDGPGDEIENVTLPGNHEQFLITALTRRMEAPSDLFLIWLANGGFAILDELGLRDPSSLVPAILERIGEERFLRLNSLKNHWRHSNYLFVHAGLHPGLGQMMLHQDWREFSSRDTSEDSDPLWIRGPFLTHRNHIEPGLVVVHGHTPADEPELLPWRINLDTGAYFTGRLTCLELLGHQMRIFQTRGTA